jgi:AhpD family alkylhydroperoxidase
MTSDYKAALVDGLAGISHLGETAPGTVSGYQQLHASGSETDCLGAKTRELIAIAVAVTTRSQVCILNHVAKARDLGATRSEISEALGVAVAMNAGAAIVYSGQAIEAFDQFSAMPSRLDRAIDALTRC